jgi:hypothetical protein
MGLANLNPEIWVRKPPDYIRGFVTIIDINKVIHSFQVLALFCTTHSIIIEVREVIS